MTLIVSWYSSVNTVSQSGNAESDQATQLHSEFQRTGRNRNILKAKFHQISEVGDSTG